MVEVTEKMVEWHFLNKKQGIKIYYCYTPLCGTCKLAKEMLEAWHKQHSHATIYTVNLNINRKLAMDWKIKSVPYVAVFVNGLKAHEFYAFHSVENIDRQLAPFIRRDETKGER